MQYRDLKTLKLITQKQIEEAQNNNIDNWLDCYKIKATGLEFCHKDN